MERIYIKLHTAIPIQLNNKEDSLFKIQQDCKLSFIQMYMERKRVRSFQSIDVQLPNLTLHLFTILTITPCFLSITSFCFIKPFFISGFFTLLFVPFSVILIRKSYSRYKTTKDLSSMKIFINCLLHFDRVMERMIKNVQEIEMINSGYSLGISRNRNHISKQYSPIDVFKSSTLDRLRLLMALFENQLQIEVIDINDIKESHKRINYYVLAILEQAYTLPQYSINFAILIETITSTTVFIQDYMDYRKILDELRIGKCSTTHTNTIASFNKYELLQQQIRGLDIKLSLLSNTALPSILIFI